MVIKVRVHNRVTNA